MIRLGESRKGSLVQLAKYVATGHERLARFRALRGRNLEATHHVAEYRRVDPDNRFRRLDRILLTEALVAWIERRFTDSIRILEDALSNAMFVKRYGGIDDSRFKERVREIDAVLAAKGLH